MYIITDEVRFTFSVVLSVFMNVFHSEVLTKVIPHCDPHCPKDEATGQPWYSWVEFVNAGHAKMLG